MNFIFVHRFFGLLKYFFQPDRVSECQMIELGNILVLMELIVEVKLVFHSGRELFDESEHVKEGFLGFTGLGA